MTNSARATGPITEAGKAISSRNAVKHNLTSIHLTGTDLDELNVLRAKLDAEWQPATETETALVHQIALSQWRMERSVTLELQAFNDEHLDTKLLSLALRYRNSAERAFYKALKELQGIRKAGSVSQTSESLSPAPSTLIACAEGALFVSQTTESLIPSPSSLNPVAGGGLAPGAVGAPFVSQTAATAPRPSKKERRQLRKLNRGRR